MSQLAKFAVVFFIGLSVGIVGVWLQTGTSSTDRATQVVESDEKTPLYWVAPMDASYRRDQPGKSPMGMDLVPVYDDEAESDVEGAVFLPAHVINNLGVKTEHVALGKLMTQRKAVGYVTYDPSSLIDMNPRIEGWIETLLVHAEGEPVTQGQPLYEVYSHQLVNAQEELVLALTRSNKSLTRAAKHRLEALKLPEGFIDELINTRKVKQTVVFTAPQSGVITQLNVKQGDYIQPAQTVMTLGQLDTVWVDGQFFPADLQYLKVGMAASLRIDGLTKSRYQGVVDYIYPELDPALGTARVRVSVANTDNTLKPNMFGQLSVSLTSEEAVLHVPRHAVIRTGDQDRVVLALGDGQFASVSVDVGTSLGDRLEILDGLSADQRIVTSGQFLIDSESNKSQAFARMEPSQVELAVEKPAQSNMSHHGDHSGMLDANSQNKSMQHQNMSHQRMAHQTMTDQTMTGRDHSLAPSSGRSMGIDIQSATVNGTINHIDVNTKTMNISREAIAKWQRPAATMDFVLANHLHPSHWQAEEQIRFTFEVRDELVIVQIEKLDTKGDHGAHHHD